MLVRGCLFLSGPLVLTTYEHRSSSSMLSVSFDASALKGYSRFLHNINFVHRLHRGPYVRSRVHMIVQGANVKGPHDCPRGQVSAKCLLSAHSYINSNYCKDRLWPSLYCFMIIHRIRSSVYFVSVYRGPEDKKGVV